MHNNTAIIIHLNFGCLTIFNTDFNSFFLDIIFDSDIVCSVNDVVRSLLSVELTYDSTIDLLALSADVALDIKKYNIKNN